MIFPSSTAYGCLMLAGIFASLFLWARLARNDSRLVLIYIAALMGAFLGAKLVYLAAEGWLHWHDPDRWMVLATGKSITGALLGGYVAVEIAKRVLGYQRTTGDWFAVIVPVGIMLGRVGCFLNGCCLGRECKASWFTLNDTHGIARWPAVPVEFFFNALMLAIALWMRSRKILPGQHFHIFLMTYGLFRFFHEFLRDTPQIIGAVSGYQLASLAVAALGAIGFYLRRREQHQSAPAALPELKSAL